MFASFVKTDSFDEKDLNLEKKSYVFFRNFEFKIEIG